MQVKIDKGSIVKALSMIQTVTEKKGFPFLSHVLLNAEDKVLKMIATDLDILLEVTLDADILDDGTITAPAKRLLDVAREFPGESIELVSENTSRLKISAENIIFDLPSFDPEDFPMPHNLESVEFKPCNRDVLRRAFVKTSHAVPSVDNQLAGAGLYWLPLEDAKHRFVACDVNRLASYEVSSDELGLDASHTGVLIPKKGVIEFLKFLDENESLEISVGERGLFARSDTMLLWIKLVEDYFAFYNDLVQEVRENSILIPTSQFKQTLKRMAIFTDQTWRHLKFKISNDLLELEAGNPEIGVGKEIIPIKYQGEDFTVAFNLRYVADAVNVIDSEFIQFEWIDEIHGGIFLDLEDESYLAMVMSMVSA